MRTFLIFLAGAMLMAACSEPRFTYEDEINDHRKRKDNEMRLDNSPIPASERENFKGLHYFDPDPAYKVNARFVPIDTGGIVEMATSTERIARFRVAGKLLFTLHDTALELFAYESTEYQSNEYFVPFLDETNGFETYGGGRYLDIPIPDTNTVVLDFNLAYNPYCAYNHDYSCVVPPLENALPVKILAGEKNYHE